MPPVSHKLDHSSASSYQTTSNRTLLITEEDQDLINQRYNLPTLSAHTKSQLKLTYEKDNDQEDNDSGGPCPLLLSDMLSSALQNNNRRWRMIEDMGLEETIKSRDALDTAGPDDLLTQKMINEIQMDWK